MSAYSLCMVCNKAIATVHVVRIINGQIAKVDYCADCASQKTDSGLVKNNNQTDLINSLFNTESEAAEPVRSFKTHDLTCPRCGLTYSRFKDIWKLGCPDCYTTFKDTLRQLLRRMHGSTQHQGKSPSRIVDLVQRDKKIWELRQQLQQAVSTEDYEQAARLRDLIQQAELN